MRLRPYIPAMDYQYLAKWIGDEKTHAMWCANRFPYPITAEGFHKLLEKSAMQYTDSAYVATGDNGIPVGFFCYSVNIDDNTGFLKFVIIDNQKRGTGCGRKMLQLALQYAFHITGVSLVQLYVFEENTVAVRCYERVGFHKEDTAKNTFSYHDEQWGRCHMVISK